MTPTFDNEWLDTYTPIANPIAIGGPEHEGEMIMFETYGEELDTVRAAKPECIWTLIECDECQVISKGFHLVNRIGYLITEEPHTNDPNEEYMYWDDEDMD